MPTIPLLDQQEIARILDRLASQVRERHAHCDQVMLVGIERRGADLARRLAALLGHGLGRPVPLGTLDINLYRDDWTSLEGKPHIGRSCIPEDVDGRVVILVDDVLLPDALSGPPWRPSWTTAAPAPWNCWCWWTAATVSYPSRRTM